MFSATFSDDIRRLSGGILRDPATVEVAPRNTTLEAIRQLVYPVDRDRKEALLAHLIRQQDLRQVLVFTRTKLAATRLADRLDREGLDAVAIHSDRSQPERTRALEGFKSGRHPDPRRDRRGRPRARHRGPAGRRQLRASVESAGLHPPDRTDRAGRRDRRRDLARLHRRDRPAPSRPADAQAGDPMDRRGRASSPTGTPNPDRWVPGWDMLGRSSEHHAHRKPVRRPARADGWAPRLTKSPAAGRLSPAVPTPGSGSDADSAGRSSTTAPGKKNPSMTPPGSCSTA